MFRLLALLMILTSCFHEANFSKGDCVQKPDEVFKWKVLEKREHESIVESVNNAQSSLGEKNQKRISNSESWIITDC